MSRPQWAVPIMKYYTILLIQVIGRFKSIACFYCIPIAM